MATRCPACAGMPSGMGITVTHTYDPTCKAQRADDLLRVYLDPNEIDEHGYPHAWNTESVAADQSNRQYGDGPRLELPIKDLIRERDGHRCLRCHHPYKKGMGRWSPCDEECTHGGSIRSRELHRGDGEWLYYENAPIAAGDHLYDEGPDGRRMQRWETEAEYRILTVHHLNGVKHDCRWWNLVSLCQRCHLSVQTRVVMARPYWGEHSEWFKPFVAAFYANIYLEEEPTWEETQERMEEFLSLEHRQQQMGVELQALSPLTPEEVEHAKRLLAELQGRK